MATIDDFLQEMKALGASDLLMMVGYPPMLRLHGELILMDNQPILTAASNMKILTEILTPDQQEYVNRNQDFGFVYTLEGVGRFRGNIQFLREFIGGSFRIIPPQIPSLEELNLPPVIQTIAEYRHGLVLVTGPPGSGKSTILAAMINHINNTREARVITIEDPVEFVHSEKRCRFTQREIGTHANNHADALLWASRENSDIILIGEIPNHETISLALTCAELDILVLGVLHTNSASKTIDWIINGFPANQQVQVRTMLAESLRAVITQQLLKTKDGQGRCPANEILIVSPDMASAIQEGKISQINELIQNGSSEDMQSMDQHLMKLIRDGTITREAAYEKAVKKTLFV